MFWVLSLGFPSFRGLICCLYNVILCYQLLQFIVMNYNSMLSLLAIFWYQIFLWPICSCIHFQAQFYFTWSHIFTAKVFLHEIQDIHVKRIVWSSHSSQPIDQLKLSHLLLLWCTAITGYHTSSGNSNIQQKPMAIYRQTSKSLPGESQPRRVKPPQTKHTCNNSTMLTLFLLFYTQAMA